LFGFRDAAAQKFLEWRGVGYRVTGVEAVVVRSSVHRQKTCCEPSRQRGGGKALRK